MPFTPLLAALARGQRQSSESFLLFYVTPFTSVCVAWPVQVQPRSGEREQPLFSGVLNVPVWPLTDGE